MAKILRFLKIGAIPAANAFGVAFGFFTNFLSWTNTDIMITILVILNAVFFSAVWVLFWLYYEHQKWERYKRQYLEAWIESVTMSFISAKDRQLDFGKTSQYADNLQEQLIDQIAKDENIHPDTVRNKIKPKRLLD